MQILDNITLIIITYKSEKIIYDFIKKIPQNIKAIIVENSKNSKLKEDIEKNYKNISLYLKDNNGVSSALNFAVEKIDTQYFLQISPDIEFDYNDLELFFNFAKKINDKFGAIGPRFINTNKKSHKQINKNIEYGKINSIHGSCMFINKENFYNLGKFDENFFLYYEETEYCYRARKKGYFNYQINRAKVKTLGRSVEMTSENNDITNILIWHFIWSKFYFSKKKYGILLSSIFFTPLLCRILLRLMFCKMLKKKDQYYKYKYRLDGLLKSMQGKKSDLRP